MVKDGVGVEAAAGRPQLVLVSEPRCGGEGESFASKQATASGGLGGPSRSVSCETRGGVYPVSSQREPLWSLRVVRRNCVHAYLF